MVNCRKPYDYIVVLGAAVLPDGSASAPLRRRILHAIELYHQGVAPRILLSGGAVAHVISEAKVMAEIAHAHQVPPDALVLEETSRNTYENALNCCSLLGPQNNLRLILVSDGFHLARAKRCFGYFGYSVEGSAAPIGASDSRLHYVLAYLRERLASVKYRMFFDPKHHR